MNSRRIRHHHGNDLGMATYGKIEAFDEGNEEWSQYVERLGHYFLANDIANQDKKRAIYLSVCGSKVYKLMCDLLAPAKPGDKSYQELTELVKNHLQPKPSEIVQRYKFHTAFRQNGQTIAEYVAQLRHLSRDCNFGESLEAMLRDRLVCGVNDDKIQRRLLSERELTYKKAVDVAIGMEQAAKGAADLQCSKGEVNIVRSGPQSSKSENRSVMKDCWRCGGNKHSPAECHFKDKDCFNCGIAGHTSRMCRKPKQQSNRKGLSANKGDKSAPNKYSQKQKYLEEDDNEQSDNNDSMNEYSFYRMGEQKEKPLLTTVELNNIQIPMEIDTGASKTVVSEVTMNKLNTKLKPTHVKLRTYTGEEIPIKGQCEVQVAGDDIQGPGKILPVIVVEGDGPNLIGRDWLSEIQLNWQNIFFMRQKFSETVLEGFEEVFDGKLGTYKGDKAKIHVKENATPKYFKARSVPFALKDQIGEELDRLEKEGTIEKVQYSEWAAPIVPLVKQDGNIRICGDYKVTVNPVAQLDNYPIPKAEDLFANLKGKYFTKLDLSHAYQQIELEAGSKKYTTINTHKGLYQYNRLCFGISSSPGIFQRIMDNILQGLPNVRVRVDDILIAANTVKEHNEILQTVLSRLQSAGLKLNKNKCIFMSESVEYLGHKITEEGVEALSDKVEAVKMMKRPKDKKELHSYLGLINYYAKFMPNLSTVLAPLYKLLQKGEQFKWEEIEERAWLDSKKLLINADILVHFDQDKEVVLTCDASPYGLGAVLAHKMSDGTERPIAFASRTLKQAERNYSHVEKEGLAMIFGVKKFHQYLYGVSFTIITDHKPLLGLFKENKGTSTMASARIQRWSVLLGAYNYKLVHRPGVTIGHADGLSRFPMEGDNKEPPVPGEVILLMEHVETMPVLAKNIRKWTTQDKVLSKVRQFVLQGWPEKNTDEEIRPYFARKTEISVVDDCLLWGSRVIVPPQGRQLILDEIHEGHPGISRMKSLGRSYVWWPRMDEEIEHHVKACKLCQVKGGDPGRAELHPWEWPRRPWSRVHIDYAGPVNGKMLLVIIDAYSKWLDVYPTTTSTSAVTIELLRQSFAIYGLPDIVVSDNGPCFSSEEFERYTKMNGIKHIRSAPYHPSTNGLAERAVKTVKQGLKKQAAATLQTQVSRFLFQYRTTCQATTGQTPSELMFGRRVKTRLDLVTPNLRSTVEQKQYSQTQNYPHTNRGEYQEGDTVYVRNYGVSGEKWVQGVIMEKSGPVGYKVQLQNQSVVKRHLDQIKKCVVNDRVVLSEDIQDPRATIVDPNVYITPEPVPEIQTSGEGETDIAIESSPGKSVYEAESEKPQRLVRPVRERKIPTKFKDYVC